MRVLERLMRRTATRLRVQMREWRREYLDAPSPEDQIPLRSELFSAEQMEQHGRSLARTHVLTEFGARDRLLRRLGANERVLIETCDVLKAVVSAQSPIAPAGEWLLDNFYLIEEQIRTARQHLPSDYSRELPCLAHGHSRGLPRVYDLALEAISHGDGRVDSATLSRFVASYQSVTPLTLGELWAIPIMLRLALIENLRRVSARITAARIHVNQAQVWANLMMATAESDPKSLIIVVADMARSNPPMASAFVAELARRLQGHGPALALPLSWIEQRLAESSQTIEQMVLSENQQQAADQVSIGNSVGSLRFLGAMDWREFVEAMSFVEHILRKDPAQAYPAMDFTTRDHYRQVIDRLAKRSAHSETEIARTVVELAGKSPEAPQNHIGFYLVDRGLRQLEQAVAARYDAGQRARRWLSRSPQALYFGSIALLTALFTAALAVRGYHAGVAGNALAALTALLVLAFSPLAIAVTQWMATLLAAPKRLPRMDYSRGLPASLRTLVVIPTLLVNRANVDELCEALEVRYLGNQDAHLHFALLTDFCDATAETLPADDALLCSAREGIAQLNQKYPRANESDGDRFFLLHRPRRWNAREKIWMGYERKRGKLADLNLLLRGQGNGRFSEIVGDIRVLASVKYVITLDTDTLLPRDVAGELIGTMAHPLNRPRYDEARRRVTGGYGILQPAVAASMSAVSRSRYAQLCGSEPGIDPYTSASSDVYQDLFGEGSFIGKGIYEVDAFERALLDRFPENRILSHDLLEGCHARSGLLSDVSLFEEYPARYLADVRRQARWIRGDWQIAQWLLPRVPGGHGRALRNPLSALSRWKIFDNLRRSLTPAALLALLFAGWMLLPLPWLWTLAVASVVLIPAGLATFTDAIRKPREVHLRQHLAGVLRSAGRSFTLAGFRLACLPFEAYYSLDAIVRTLWRMAVSRHRLLEWAVASHGASALGVGAAYRAMWIAPFTAVAAAFAAGLNSPHALAAAALFFIPWSIAPLLAAWLSAPRTDAPVQLDAAQTLFLRKISRKTWAFFERFVSVEDHWLPPDNFQEQPGPVTAHRTSPTNMGLALLANLAAYDFGYIPAGVLLARTANAFATMAQLPRHRGHFFNWYDTQTLNPLPPRYLSSVDSGNLVGHLLTLRAGLLALADQPVLGPQILEGLHDALALLADAAAPEQQAVVASLQECVTAARAVPPSSPAAWQHWLESAERLAAPLSAGLDPASDMPAVLWAHALTRQCQEALAEIRLFSLAGEKMPTLRELAHHHDAARERLALCAALVEQCTGFSTIEYEFLYDRSRHLLAIGYNADDSRRDNSYYDLLASEARLTSFVAIAQGQLPQESWFALSRLLTGAGGAPILVSWSGSMFEYLMPQLVMPTYEGTLLDQTCRVAVARQIAYGRQCDLPWGVSESGYNTVDANLNYQYHAFGVPGLGLKRGLAEDWVVAPYASALALMVAPREACANLQTLSAAGLEGAFGFYEAIDYTPSRLPRGTTHVIVRSYMAHHQGMNLLALAYRLLGQPMQRRFEADPQFQATLLLLQERIPRASVIHSRTAETPESAMLATAQVPAVQAPIGAQTQAPEVQLLSNGRYHVMVSNAGGGYSRWKDLAVTRWREDASTDPWGSFIYLRDATSNEFWSATHQPTLKRAQTYEALFNEGRAEFRRHDHDIESHLEITVSPEDDIELRRLKLSNRSRVRRTIEITSYSEIVLAPPAADATQPSFGSLFLQTEILAERHAIVCTRRQRSPTDTTPWMFHRLSSQGETHGTVTFETDRMRFIGRGRTLRAPRALDALAELSASQGSVLDPIAAIRCTVQIEPGQSVTLDWVSGAAGSREACLSLVEKYQDRHMADRVFELAWTHSAVALRQINVGADDAQLYRRLAGPVLYANAALRADASVVAQNRRGQSNLWPYAISGDLPIVLLKISDSAHLELARQMIQCHAYWRLKGLTVDLVIWNEDHISYRQRLQDQILGLIATGNESHAIDRPGGIFVRYAEQLSPEDRLLLQAVARVIVSDSAGALAQQVNRRALSEQRVGRLMPSRAHRAEPPAAAGKPRPELILSNDFGGFTADGSEYHISTAQTQRTPAPWVNVMANAHFGTVITESGLAYTWCANAHEFRLTPWSDDAVGASGGEAIYLRDEESGHFWSPAPLPCGGAMPYLTRHGFGYSVFEHTSGGIRSELWVYVDLEDAVKFSVLKVRNGSGRSRRLSATGYVEWVLGDQRPKTAMHVVTDIDASSGALFARNSYNTDFGGHVAFFDVDDLSRTLTGDRSEFLGRNGSLGDPEALSRARLSGRVGAALDPCGAIQVPFELLDGQEREIIFRLGAAPSHGEARKLVQRLRKTGSARRALEKVRAYWTQTLSAVQVETPDAALNVLTNGWLVYQTLACRVRARSGFYQSGGAFGFRDQLQDLMALVHTQPALLREHLLLCASRQFAEGDVQHWWHPPAGRGVRTRCSDDYLWLPLAACRYVLTTGDTGVLHENVHFLDARALGADEESNYDLPVRSTARASLYQHCVRAIEHAFRFGEHDLPLMGSGDWNDGMSRVGIDGQGESVWLGFFLHEVLVSFAKLAGLHGDLAFVERCHQQAAQLKRNLDQHAWDGEWYRRAWFDDGTKLGSHENAECSIDSISQSWSVLSGAGDPARVRTAMDSLDRRLVRRDARLIQLLDPPFDHSPVDPGYIKGYVPGVRENGGQYTHAAIWAAMAFAQLGDSRRAWELTRLINPVNHARTAAEVAVYKAEPYVVAADVYAVAPHTGRAGWTWYTGSAGWLYRLIIESLLGLKRENDRLRFNPCLPEDWPALSLSYRYYDTPYRIRVVQTQGVDASIQVTLDGIEQFEPAISLVNDQKTHEVMMRITQQHATRSTAQQPAAVD